MLTWGVFYPVAITCQLIALGSCPNPVKMGKILWFAMKKIILDLDVVFYWCLHDGNMFMHILFSLGWRHQALDANAKSHFFDSSFYWKVGYNTSL